MIKALSTIAIAGMAFGMATAQTVVYERGVETLWSASDKSAWALSGSSTTSISLDDGLKAVENGNTSFALTCAVATKSTSKVTYKVNWFSGYSTGNAGNYNYLRMCGVELRSWGQNMTSGVVLSGTETVLFTKNKDLSRGATWDATIVVDKAKSTAEYDITITASNGTSRSFKGNGPISNPSNEIVFGFNKGGRTQYAVETSIRSISVTEEEQEIATAAYVVKFVDEQSGEELKASSERMNVAGDSIALTPGDTERFDVDGKKYIYVSSDEKDMVVAADGSTVVTVKFRKAAIYTYHVKSNHGDLLREGEAFENEMVFAPVPRFIFGSDNMVLEAVPQSETVYYRADFEISHTEYMYRVDYMKKPSYGAKVAFVEGENLEGLVNSGNGNVPARASNGEIGYAKEESNFAVCKVPAGSYRLRLSVVNFNQSDLYVTVLADENEVGSLVAGVNSSSNVYTDLCTEAFTTTADETTIYLKSSQGGSTMGVDYVLLTTADALEGVDQTPEDAKLDDRENGLRTPNAKRIISGTCNLRGERVKSGTKGLLIENGKLVFKL